MPRLPLARAHRPQRFSEVLGQGAAVRALGQAAKKGEVASCYIFSGTRGIGKTTIARIFAKSLNCERGPAEDCCNECAACTEIASGRAMDVLELDAATHTGIDDIRELREAAQYPPSRDRRRVFILDEAHQLSSAAWNGLLKILEEPPAWCVFVFCTTEPHKIPATIESRALHFAFKSPAPAELRGHLGRIAASEGLEVDDEALALLVEAAAGSVRDGLSALDQVRALGGERIDAEAVRDALGLVPGEAVQGYVDALVAGDAAAALAIVERLDEEGQDLSAFAQDALARTRGLALERVRGGAGGEGLDTAQLVWIGRVLDESALRLRQGGPERVILDLATIRMARMAALEDLRSLAAKVSASASGPRTGPGPGPGTGPGPGPGPGYGGGGPRPGPTRPDGGPPPWRSGGGGSPRRASESPPRGGGFRPPTGGPAGSGPSGGAPPRERAQMTPASPTPAPSPASGAGGGPAQAISPASPAEAPHVAPDAELKDPLYARIFSSRPLVATTLSRAHSVRLDERGALRIVLPSSLPGAGQRLGDAEAQALIREAVRELCGREPASIAIESSGNKGPTPRAARRASRDAVMERARQDPAVKLIFDHFGATLIDGESLEQGDAEKPGAPESQEP